MLARVNSVREEPGGAGRLFVTDMNGPVYILDKKTKALTTYLDFNGSGDRPGLFDRLLHDPGYSSGISQFQFDPDYRRNGKFYTVHMESPALPGSQRPDTTKFPGLTFGPFGYEPTAAVSTPGPINFESVLIEWTDTNLRNITFEGTAREILRVQLNGRIHPMGELMFHPTARSGDPEWRVMYVGIGDGGAGESRTAIRPNPQRLDTLVGKILRIIPDAAEHVATSTLSDNGQYRIPHDNPFVSKPGAKKEIWAYGLRNPHRLSWAADPSDARRQHLIAAVVGLRTWEMVSIIRKGANYGYSQREGNQLLQPDNVIAPLPAVDKIPVQIGDEVTDEIVVPTYPVVQYGHVPEGGDGIGSGYVYTGKALPALRGKYKSSRTCRPDACGTPTGKRWSQPTTAIRRRWRRCTKSSCTGTIRSTILSRRSRKPRIRHAEARIPTCRAAEPYPARAVPTRGSRSMPQASCSSTARPTV